MPRTKSKRPIQAKSEPSPLHNIRIMRVVDLEPAPYNPRTIAPEALSGLEASLKRFGLVQPIVWNKRSRMTVGGHQRVAALRQAGVQEAQVIEVDLNQEEERALNITLNNPNIAGEFTDGLHALLASIKSAMPEDFVSLRLSDLLDQISAGIDHSPVVEDEVSGGIPKVATTKKGDLWILGKHRLLCGDSTNVQHVEKVLPNGADMIFTDPPWNVAIGQDSNPKHRQREGLENDDLGENFQDFLHAWSAACLPSLNGDLYCVMGCSEWPGIDKAFRDAGMHWSATIIWVKDSFVIGRSNYHSRFEPIWYGWPEKGSSSYVGKRDQDDVWEFPRPKASEDHPTMKPIGLVARAVQNSTVAGGIVFDPFGGSGTTLLACEQLGRSCSTIEIDPRYCDVIIRRLEQATGQTAVLDKV